MKLLIAIGVLLLALSIPLMAQDSPDQFFGAGMSYNGYSAPNVGFNLLYAKKIQGNTYSFTHVDVISKSIKPFTVTPSVTTGFAQELFKINKLPIYGTTSVGLAAGGNDIGWSWTAGFTGSISLSKGWHLLPTVRVIKSSLTDFQGIYGLIIGWGQ